MNKNVKIFSQGLIIMLMFTCQTKHCNYIYTNYMHYYQDIFHQKLNLEIVYQNHIMHNQEILKNPQYKVVNLINTECTSCFKEIEAWNRIIKKNQLYKKTQVIFIATGKRTDYFSYVINSNKFDFDIYMDSLNTFIKNNKLENYPKETFLLNSEDEIILVGSPQNNPQLKILYKYLIQ